MDIMYKPEYMSVRQGVFEFSSENLGNATAVSWSMILFSMSPEDARNVIEQYFSFEGCKSFMLNTQDSVLQPIIELVLQLESDQFRERAQAMGYSTGNWKDFRQSDQFKELFHDVLDPYSKYYAGVEYLLLDIAKKLEKGAGFVKNPKLLLDLLSELFENAHKEEEQAAISVEETGNTTLWLWGQLSRSN